MIVAYIDTYRDRFGVEPICTVLSEHGMKIAPSTYYARKACPLSDAALEEAYLVNAIFTLWQENWRVYGVRKLYHEACRTGLGVGRDQVARLMRIAGIRGVRRGTHHTVTTRRDEAAARHPDLVKRGWDAPTGVDQLWVGRLLVRVDAGRVRVRRVRRGRVLPPDPGLAGDHEQANHHGD